MHCTRCLRGPCIFCPMQMAFFSWCWNSYISTLSPWIWLFQRTSNHEAHVEFFSGRPHSSQLMRGWKCPTSRLQGVIQAWCRIDKGDRWWCHHGLAWVLYHSPSSIHCLAFSMKCYAYVIVKRPVQTGSQPVFDSMQKGKDQDCTLNNQHRTKTVVQS